MISADLSLVIVNESLILEAMLKAKPGDLDRVLAAVEAYRLCVNVSQKLVRSRRLHQQQTQVLECAEYCEGVLSEFTQTGRMMEVRYPPDSDGHSGTVHISLSIE